MSEKGENKARKELEALINLVNEYRKTQVEILAKLDLALLALGIKLDNQAYLI